MRLNSSRIELCVVVSFQLLVVHIALKQRTFKCNINRGITISVSQQAGDSSLTRHSYYSTAVSHFTCRSCAPVRPVIVTYGSRAWRLWQRFASEQTSVSRGKVGRRCDSTVHVTTVVSLSRCWHLVFLSLRRSKTSILTLGVTTCCMVSTCQFYVSLWANAVSEIFRQIKTPFAPILTSFNDK